MVRSHLLRPAMVDENPLISTDSPPLPPPVQTLATVHPLGRTDDDRRLMATEKIRIRVAWAKLLWLMAFLAVLLAISYLVPYIAEHTQYAITRGKQRAEFDFAQQHLGESPIAEM